MGSGFEVSGVDLDSIFAPLQAGWPQAAACKYTVGGVDLNQRYAKLSSGGAAAATGYKDSAANDLNTYFAAAGSTGVQVGTQPSNFSGSSAAGFPSGTVTSGSVTCAGAKGAGSYTYTWHTTNCTATSPNSATTTFHASVDASSTDDASAFCTISDGVTSVNTNTVSGGLQNTSPTTYVGNGVAGTITLDNVDYVGYGTGTPTIGSLSPTADPSGHTILTLQTQEDLSTGEIDLVLIINADLAQDYFPTITINGGAPLPSSAATFTPGTQSQWYWSNSGVIFTSGDEFSVSYAPSA